MSAIDATMLAAWEQARQTKGDAAVFVQRGTPAYDVTTGLHSDTAEVSTVSVIISPVSKSQAHLHDLGGVQIDTVIQAKRSELEADPQPGDRVSLGGDYYEVVRATAYTFGVTELYLKAVS